MKRTVHPWGRGLGVGATVSVALLGSADALASNVTEVPDNGSEQMGRGGAWVARASDPLATTFNPAGLAGQPSRLTIQTNIAFQHTCFTRLKAASDLSSDPLADGTGHFPRVCNDIEPNLSPQFGGTLRINDRLGLGLLVIAPSTAGVKTWPDFVQDGAGQLRASPQRYLMAGQSGIILFPTVGVGSLLAAKGAELVAPNVLSLLHWERIEHGALYASSSRIDWRSLLRRTFQVDLRLCQRCGGRLSVRAVVTEPDDIERVLASIRRSRDPPAAA